MCRVPARLTGDAERMAIGPKRVKVLSVIERYRHWTLKRVQEPGAL
jgi:hypothetical protein